jgi:PPK2 family polyphosphate:nucleotide phosphotransferase
MAHVEAPHPQQLKRYQHANPDKPFDLAAIDPREKPFSSGDKARDQAQVDRLAMELDELQNLLFADNRHKLLVVLQGTDTSGKDGTLRHIFSRLSPLGVRAVAWKVPTEEERDHDFLWRIHAQVPRNGELVAFNRSHYEDVLVPWVEGMLKEDELLRRYAQINDFERMLTETGTTIAKFMLHISSEEQRERLQARIDDPAKRWKFQRGDLEVRKKWDAYQQAYARAISMTGTPWAPWTVVPADSKTHRNLMVATILKQVMQDMHLALPDDRSIAKIEVT